MSLEIRRVESGRDLKNFIDFPFAIFGDNPTWVPPLFVDELNTLSRKKNPAFEFCDAEYWMAFRDGVVVGRIAGIINHRYVEKWGNKYARFGWMDFIDDFEVAEALVRTVEDWARAKGMVGLNGPLGFTDLDKEGLLIEGFDELPTFATIYNLPYYPAFLERLGYAKDTDWMEYEIKVPTSIPDKVLRVQDLISKRSGIHLSEWKTPRELKKRYAKDIFALVDEAYSHLYGTTPLSVRQVEAYIKQYLGFADPRFIKIVVDKEERLVAFGIAIPSLSRALQKSRGKLFPFGWLHLMAALRKPSCIDMLLVAIDPKQQSLGSVAFLMTSIIRSCQESGVVLAETNPELETNHEVQGLWKDYERRQHKRRRAYLKML